jgi:tRNA(His) 5'-end guanylyltransferase
MKRDEFEAMGDRHKAFESLETMRRLMPGLPVVVRLDGRAFHTFTRGLQRPYDARLSRSMIETAKYLVEQTHADIGYTQSDEISLGFSFTDPCAEMPFKGRVQKICSLFAAMATARFNQLIVQEIPEKANKLPLFDAHVFQYPTLGLATECFVWREADATRNSLTMAAHAYYSQKELHKAGYAKKHEMLFAKGINWNDYPAFFKRGTYVRRETIFKELTQQELARIPEGRRPTGPVMRSQVMELEMPPILEVANAAEVLFARAEPLPYKQGPALQV